MELELGGVLDATRLRWAQAMAHAHGTRHPLHVRLASLKEFTPGGVVALLALVDDVRQSGRTVQVDRAGRSQVNEHLAAFGFCEVLDALGVEHDLPRSRAGLGRFGVHLFCGADELEAQAEAAFDWARQDSVDHAGRVFVALAEAGQNVLDHTGRDHGFVAADRTGREIRFAVGDSGNGFRASLADRGAENDRQAVEMALAHGVSATGQPGRGHGLAELARQNAIAGGRTIVMSGSADLEILPAAAQTLRTSVKTIPASRGAVVGGILQRGTPPPSARDVA